MKIGIAIPIYRNVCAEFFVNFINRLSEVLKTTDLEFEILMKPSTTIDLARNDLVEYAKERKCDLIWFIDDDHIIREGILQQMIFDMKEYKADIVTGLYFTKTRPHIPVIRTKNDTKHEYIFDIDFGEVIEIDGCGMGCCLIDMKVFDKLEYPWFQFKYEMIGGKKRHLSEDLYFCDMAKKVGCKIICDTKLIIPHIGAIADDISYKYFKDNLIKSDEYKNELIEDLMEFDKISYDEVIKNIETGNKLMRDEYLKINPKTKEERDNYYKESKYIKYDLVSWHLNGRRSFDVKLVDMIKTNFPDKSINILDFGCGTGDNGFLIGKEGYRLIHLYDINGNTLQFAKYRFEKHKVPCKVLYDLDKIKTKFDVILCFDVLEHLDDEDFKKAISIIKKLKSPNGKVFSTSSFGLQSVHPSHFDYSDEKRKLIESLM